jgi:hypothetical protein
LNLVFGAKNHTLRSVICGFQTKVARTKKMMTSCFVEKFSLTPGFSRVRENARGEKSLNGFSQARL